MMSSEQLERQTEQSRAEVEMTIDELRARLTPGQLIDEVLSYTRDGGRQFTSNLGRQVTDNPLPVVLMGAGLAWFLLGRDTTSSNGNGFRAESTSYGAGHAMSGLGDAAGKAGDAVQGAFGGVRHAAESAGSAVSDTAQKLGETASSAYHAASSTVSRSASDLANSATAFEQKTMRAARDLMVQAKDQPLVIVGLGLAIGAIVGAAIPETDIENRAMGDIADDVKRDAKQVASEQFDKAKDVAQRFVDETANGIGNGSERVDGIAAQRDHFG